MTRPTLRQEWIPIPILAMAALLRFCRLGAPALIGDEAYYWFWSRHLDLSYYDHPAGVALMVRLSTLVGGEGELGIRLLNATLGLVSVALIYLVGRQLFSPVAGVIAGVVLALGAPYLVISRFAYTDALQLALVLASLWLLIPVVLQPPSCGLAWRYWAAGLTMALLLNTKYSAYLFAPALLIVLLVEHGEVVREGRSWGAIGLAALGLAPALVWNAAHGWSSFRWQFEHYSSGVVHHSSLVGNIRHTVAYLTPPLSLLGAVALTGWRTSRERLLLVPGIALVLPAVLSPANSPRSALTGLALLVLLGAHRLAQVCGRFTAWGKVSVAGVAFVVMSAYAAGTVHATLRPTVLPRSGVADALRKEVAGWRGARSLVLDGAATLYAVDYSLAGQLSYYADRPVYTSWPQYAYWGIPESDAMSVVAHSYVEPEIVTRRLREAFDVVSGPEARWLMDDSGRQELLVWTARGLRVNSRELVGLLDFVSILDEGRAQQPRVGDEGS